MTKLPTGIERKLINTMGKQQVTIIDDGVPV